MAIKRRDADPSELVIRRMGFTLRIKIERRLGRMQALVEFGIGHLLSQWTIRSSIVKSDG